MAHTLSSEPEGLEAFLLDVGHGNAAIFVDGERALVVDAGPGDLVAGTLEQLGIRDVAALVISHRHHDHDSELPSLLMNRDLRVRRLFVNADPLRNPTSYFARHLRGAFNDSHLRNGTELHQANATLGQYISTDRLEVTVLWPPADMAFAGVGAKTESGGTAHPHAMAVVLRVAVPEGRSVLLGADLDYQGFRTLLDANAFDPRSDVLVYPHHGGLTGAPDEEAFAGELACAVDPELVVFSHGRDRYENPRPEVVRGVRSGRAQPRIRVMCTQLSKHCSADPIAPQNCLDPHVTSRGASLGHSCAGSIRLSLSAGGALVPLGATHLAFVLEQVDGNLCIPATSP